MATTIFTLVFAYGTWRLSQPDVRSGPTVRLMPWSSLPRASTDPASLRGIADVRGLGRGAIRDDGTTDAGQTLEIERFAKKTDSFVAIGWLRTRPAFKASSRAVDPTDGSFYIYDKTYLVPWTEFSPWVKIPYITWSKNSELRRHR